MSLILVYPGQLSEPVPLLDVLREAHAMRRAEVVKEIADRKAKGVPLDDSTDWQKAREALDGLRDAVLKSEGPAVAARARMLAAIVDGNALEDPGEFVAPLEGVDLSGVVVTFRMVSDDTRRGWAARAQRGWQRMRDALVADDPLARRAADEELAGVYEDEIAECVAALDGLAGLRDTVRESLPGLRLAGLLPVLHAACQHFLSLPPGKALRCGRQ